MSEDRIDDAEWIRAKLIAILNRVITVKDMYEAMGLKESTYYDRVREGRLLSLDNLKHAAATLGINEVQLLVECGLLDPVALESYIELLRGEPHPSMPGGIGTVTASMARAVREPTKVSEVRESRPGTPKL